MRILTGALFVLCMISISGIAVSAPPGATVTFVNGTVNVLRGGTGEPTALVAGDALAEGDVVEIAKGGVLEIRFGDGAVLRAVELCRFQVRMLAENARTIDLHYGRFQRFEVKEVTTGVMTSLDAFVALHDGILSAEVSAVGDQNRVVFNLLAGSDAKVVDGKTPMVLQAGKPVVVMRPRSGEGRGPGAGGMVMIPEGGGAPEDAGKITIGGRTLYVDDIGSFTVTRTADGGLVIQSNLPSDQFAKVILDRDTTFFVAGGASITFSGAGVITRHNAIQHVWRPLNIRGRILDPILEIADTSYVGTRLK